jgi:hypothetical protein
MCDKCSETRESRLGTIDNGLETGICNVCHQTNRINEYELCGLCAEKADMLLTKVFKNRPEARKTRENRK